MKLNKADRANTRPTEENGWTFHPTSLEGYLRCPRKFYISSMLSLLSRTARVDLDFGNGFHAGVGMFYTVRSLEPEEALATCFEEQDTINLELEPKDTAFHLAKLASCKIFEQEWVKTGLRGSDKKNLQTGLLAMSKYCDTYRHDIHSYKPELIECTQRLKMPNGTTLEATLDRVNWSNDYICAVDSKTTGSALTDWYWKNFENSFQLGAGDHIISSICGHCDGVQIDAIKMPWSKPTDKTTPFQRRSWTLTDMQRDDWLNTYCEATSEIVANLQLPEAEQVKKFKTHGTACSDYGGCKYLPLCKHGFNHPSLSVDFIKE